MAEQFYAQKNYIAIDEWVTSFEQAYSCAGFCGERTLFAWSTPISEGPQSIDCAKAAIEDARVSFLILGLISIVSSAILCCTLCQRRYQYVAAS